MADLTAADLTAADLVVVWGNCQAGPVAELLAPPLRAVGLQVVIVPPVYLATAHDVRRIHELLPRCCVLVSQPVGPDYPQPGTSTSELAAGLPEGSRVVTFPVAFHVGPFPWSVHGHGADGRRVDAPLTDYHDMRVLVAARAGLDVDATLATLTARSTAVPDGIREVAETSRSELRRRERPLDVAVSDLLERPDSLWTMTHPSNATLTEVARRILDVLGVDEPVVPRAEEYLGQRRTPTQSPGWSTGEEWVIDGRAVPWRRIVTAQLEFYRRRPDVVTASLGRVAPRLRQLGLPA